MGVGGGAWGEDHERGEPRSQGEAWRRADAGGWASCGPGRRPVETLRGGPPSGWSRQVQGPWAPHHHRPGEVKGRDTVPRPEEDWEMRSAQGLNCPRQTPVPRSLKTPPPTSRQAYAGRGVIEAHLGSDIHISMIAFYMRWTFLSGKTEEPACGRASGREPSR